MKISFFSNFLNHHQLPFCNEMIKVLGNDFAFIATERIPEERIALGYENMDRKYSFVLPCYMSDDNQRRALKIAEESDVMIFGDAPEFYLYKRLNDNKLTFRFTERVFKNGYLHSLDPRVVKNMVMQHTRYRKKNFRLLCAGGYTACDMDLYKAYPHKMYKWGYFPEAITLDMKNIFEIKRRNEKLCILWVGRLLRWKHPEYTIYIAEYLKKNDVKFEIEIIGEGEMRDSIIREIKEKKLEDCVYYLGAMTPDKVRRYMEKANIFLFTSDYREGWGAVLNEAMNSACAVVASHAIGSVPFLLQHMRNGLIYRNGDINDLEEKVLILCRSAEMREKFGYNAYITILKKWSPSKAAENFLALSDSILCEKEVEIEVGPCSRAKVINQKGAFKYLTKTGDEQEK